MKLAQAMRIVNDCASRGGEPFRVFLACGFTPQHVQTFLTAHLAGRIPDRRVVVEVGLYGDLAGSLERLDPRQASAAAVIVEWEDLDPRLGFRSSHAWSPREMEDILTGATRQLERLHASVERVAGHAPVSVALPTLAFPPFFKAPLAWSDPLALALRERVLAFGASVAAVPAIRVLNSQRLDALSPPGARSDLKSELRWGFPYSLEHASVLSGLLAGLCLPAAPKKAIITDLDETMWRGILGEDGLDGISWHLDHGSHGHALYQRMLASLADMGVLVGVATKNDPDLVTQALAREDLIVPGDVLFPVEAHWGPKSGSVDRMLRAWNIGADSVVFVDDSEMEIAEVTAAFPGIQGVVFPRADDGILQLLETLREAFGRVTVTEEDRLRLPSLRASYQRAAGGSYVASDAVLSEAQAEIVLGHDKVDPRAFELVNKTNQFNLNGRRIDESTWKARQADPRFFVVTASYKDKFGPLGKIAVVSGMRATPEPQVDIWVMSCRAFSRRIEHHLLRALFEHLGVAALRLDVAPTDRNGPLMEFVKAVAGREVETPMRIEQADFLSRCPPLSAKVYME